MNPRDLLNFVAMMHDVQPAQVLSRSRTWEVSRVRALMCWLLVIEGEFSASAAGRFLGVDHSSVLYAVQRVETDRTLREDAQRSRRAIVHMAQQVLP